MSFADAFLRRLYSVESVRELTALVDEQTRVWATNRAERFERYMLGPVSTKCAECGLDGNHDTWCPHWQAYVADE